MKQQHIQHLYWRVGFGISISELENLKSDSKSNIITSIFSKSKDVNLLQLDLSELNPIKSKNPKVLMKEMGEAAFQKLIQKGQQKVKDLNHAWIDRLSEPTSILREKMTLFWTNTFVCRDNNIFHIHVNRQQKV